MAYLKARKNKKGDTVWQIQIFCGYGSDGRPIMVNRTSKSPRRKDAEKLVRDILAERDRGELALTKSKDTVGNLLDGIKVDYELQGRRSLDWVSLIVEAHLKPFFGTIPAAKLTSTHINQYIEHRRKAGRALSTIGNELAILRRALNLGFRAGKIARVPFIPRPKVENARQGFVEPEHYKALRDALPEHLKPLFVVGYHTGIRLGELRQMEWSQVDLLAGEIRIAGSQAKTGHPRTVPIYGDMGPFLELALSQRNENFPSCPYVFNYLGRHLGGHLKGWSKSCVAAGLPGLHFHDLRRSAVRAMERAGIPRHVAMGISGHRTEAIYRRYDIVSSRDLREAGRKLEDYLKARWTEATQTETSEKLQQ